jgi:hypothetical protein
MAAVSVSWRVMPGVVMMARGLRVPVPRRVVPRVVTLMRGLRVPVPRRVVPRVVTLMRPLRVPVPRRVMPRVMVVRVQPVVTVMVPCGQMGVDAAVVEPPRVPLTHVVPGRLRGWLWRLRGRVAAGTTSTERRTGAATRLP